MRNTILQGDVLDRLQDIPDGIVQCVVTSPPYWGLRDYSVEGQLGLEATPELYIEKMVAIFREVRRVMRDDGTLWLNMGDSYAGSGRGRDADGTWNPGQGGSKQATNAGSTIGRQVNSKSLSKNLIEQGAIGNKWVKPPRGYKPKDLCSIPWRVALALQADGWWLRSDIIWSKPNPMPESCTDRPTKAHEYIFLMTKKAKYYYDADAIREKSDEAENIYRNQLRQNKDYNLKDPYKDNFPIPQANGNRNARSVWTIATQPYPEAHFATFPEELARRCILAGSAEQACGVCGAPWERVIDYKANYGRREPAHAPNGEPTKVDSSEWKPPKRDTLGFRPTCEHKSPIRRVLPPDGSGRCIVLDPFIGSGTVALVALKGKRDFLGIELNPDYIKMAMKRIEPHLKQRILI